MSGKVASVGLARVALWTAVLWGTAAASGEEASSGWLGVEAAGLALFVAAAWVGRGRRWWLVAGIAAHAVWDAAHLGATDFVPDWYAIACAVIDVAVAGYAAGLAAQADASDSS